MNGDIVNPSVEGLVKIIDKETGAIVLDVKNAIHFGNLSAAIAKSLAGDSAGHIKKMLFGNGGTSITQAGTIFYRTTNVSTIRDDSAALYNETYEKDVSVNTTENNISVNLTNSNYADIKVTATLSLGEPSDQDAIDVATDNNGDYVFDEIGLETTEGILITHVIFHPVQKSKNRILEVEYTLRIQLG